VNIAFGTRREKDISLQSRSHWQAVHGQKAKLPEVEGKLCSYMNETSQFGYAVSNEVCQLKAVEIAKEI
jgi:hypothetical protein